MSAALQRGIEVAGDPARFRVVPNVVDTSLFRPDGERAGRCSPSGCSTRPRASTCCSTRSRCCREERPTTRRRRPAPARARSAGGPARRRRPRRLPRPGDEGGGRGADAAGADARRPEPLRDERRRRPRGAGERDARRGERRRRVPELLADGEGCSPAPATPPLSTPHSRALAQPPELEAVAARVRERHSPERVGAQLAAIYRELASPDDPGHAMVIPCFDDGSTLGEAIARCSREESHELVVVDDGSADPETLRVLDELAGAACRVLHQENRGLSAARMAGVGETDRPVCLPARRRRRARAGRARCARRRARRRPGREARLGGRRDLRRVRRPRSRARGARPLAADVRQRDPRRRR